MQPSIRPTFSHFEKLFNDDIAANCTVRTLLNVIHNTMWYTMEIQFIDIHTSEQGI